jgi:uroporphyrinogen decarboxylase
MTQANTTGAHTATSQLTKRERVEAALAGKPTDRVPVSAWRHFVPAETAPRTLADAHLDFFREYDWDWLKVNPRATYYAEAWGNRYDFADYSGVFPRLLGGPVESPADLARIQPVDPAGGVFAEHLELLRLIEAGLGGAHFLQTVFSPLSVLGFLAARPAEHSQESSSAAQLAAVRRLIDENPAGLHAALAAVAETLAGYAQRAVDAGASGIFFAIVRLARKGALTPEEHAAFGRPYDLKVLRVVQGAPLNLLHVCGPEAYFDQLSDYPVQAINWAASGEGGRGNPGVAEARTRTRLALVGGLDEGGVLQRGTPEQVEAAAREAIRASGGRGFLLAPGCGAAMDVPPSNLKALRRSAETVARA